MPPFIAICYDEVKADCYAALCYGEPMDSPGERLRWARLRANIKTIAEGARKLRLHPQNWSDHEADRRSIPLDIAKLYAKGLRVSAGWLLTGEGRPERSMIPLMGYVGAGAEVFEFDPAKIDEIDAPPGAEDGDVAFVIRGDSWMPFFVDGGVIVVRPVSDIQQALYKRCVVTLDDGRRLFKTLAPSSEPGKFSLLEASGGVIPDVSVCAVARFRVYIEP